MSTGQAFEQEDEVEREARKWLENARFLLPDHVLCDWMEAEDGKEDEPQGPFTRELDEELEAIASELPMIMELAREEELQQQRQQFFIAFMRVENNER